MQYSKCHECINAGNMCQLLIANDLSSIMKLEYAFNKALQYSRQKDDDIQIKIGFECLGFKNKNLQETIKDCSTCKYGCYNDIFNQYFCYNNSIKCENWNKWEARI